MPIRNDLSKTKMGILFQIFINKQSRAVIIGLCIGIALSILQTPFIEDDCHNLLDSNLENSFKISRDLRSNEPLNEQDEETDYEPRILLDSEFDGNIPKVEAKSKTRIFRHKYYSNELGIKKKLFIAIVGSSDTVSFFPTINKTITVMKDHYSIFVNNIDIDHHNIKPPLSVFQDTTAPVLNIFRVISLVHRLHGDNYDYFFFVTDHTYIREKKLLELVKKLSISQDVHMGALTNNPGSIYCSLDSGIILGRKLLDNVENNMNWCIRNTYSDSDSDNLGRCILHASQIPCSPLLQGQRFSSYNLRDNVDVKSHLEIIGTSSLVREAITVSGMKVPKDLLRFHVFYLEEDIYRVKKLISQSQELIKEALPNIPKESASPKWPIGSGPSHKPSTRFDVITWDTFNSTHFFHPNEHMNTKLISGADYKDIMAVLNASVAHVVKKNDGALYFRSLEYGHRRYDPSRGMEYILSISFRNNLTGTTVSRKIESFRGLTRVELPVIPYVTEASPVVVLVPVEPDDINDAVTFIRRLSSLRNLENTFIAMTLLYPPDTSLYAEGRDIFKAVKEESKIFNRKNVETNCKITNRVITTIGRRPSDFVLIDAAIKKLPEDTLFVVSRPNARISVAYLNRARMNVMRGNQIFSPVPFTFYHPDLIEDTNLYEKLEISRLNGRFDSYNTDHIGFYISDYIEARENLRDEIPEVFNENDLESDRPWEHEFDIYEMFVQGLDINILRAPDKDLKLTYKPITCPDELLYSDAYMQKCQRKRGLSMGLKNSLSKIVINYNDRNKRN